MKIINQNESIDSDSNATIPNNNDQHQPQINTNPTTQTQLITQNQLFKYNSQESTEVLHLNRKINLNNRFLKTKKTKITKKSQSRNELLKHIVEQDLNDLFDL
ncbi:unnamed protein product [Paramecium pentaurelia]|uniref:Uncharacterized protein n=1 Tax=Paramecium pentaurelia TaxID=43138 RepID=A0A8S1XNN9_9CILI|nr:unnamed protein product [Paramecium pentaurelia]